jgi:hypothetical protein
VDQPTAEEALAKLQPLVGEWILEARGPDGLPWPGEARATIEWHDSRAHLIERSWVALPEVPNGRVDHRMRRGQRQILAALRR